MYCPNCGTLNAAGAEFCINCGKPLPKLSPTGEPLPVAAEQPATPPSAWPSNPPNPFQPGQPGSQYSYRPEGNFNPYQPGPGYQPGPAYPPYPNAPYYSYTTPADRVGVASGEAGFWPRLGAYLIDGLIVGIITTVILFVPLTSWGVNFATKYQSQLSSAACDPGSAGYDRAVCNQIVTRIMIDNGELNNFLGLFFGLMGVSFLIYVLYYTLQTARGTTLGKRAFGLRVVGPDGKAPGFGRALLRHTIGYFISSAVFYVGFLWIIFDPQHQGWHDKLAGTYVIKA